MIPVFHLQYDQLCGKGNFSREDIVTVLTTNQGNVEAAFQELNKVQLKPFLMRIWGQVSFISVSYFCENLGNLRWVTYCLQWFNEFFFNNSNNNKTLSTNSPISITQPTSCTRCTTSTPPGPTPTAITTAMEVFFKMISKTMVFCYQNCSELL